MNIKTTVYHRHKHHNSFSLLKKPGDAGGKEGENCKIPNSMLLFLQMSSHGSSGWIRRWLPEALQCVYGLLTFAIVIEKTKRCNWLEEGLGKNFFSASDEKDGSEIYQQSVALYFDIGKKNRRLPLKSRSETERQKHGEIVTSIFRSHNLRQCIRRLFDFFLLFLSFSLALMRVFSEINSI